MNNFWTLTQFEYKKIFRKKSTAAVLLITILLSVISCTATLIGSIYVEGVPVESQMEAMKTDRAYSRALAGRPIDSKLLLEMSDAYSKITTEGQYTTTEEYNRYARPYSNIYAVARVVYNTHANKFGVADAQALTQEQADSFYSTRAARAAEDIGTMVAGDAAKARLLELDSHVKTPIIFDYAEGYTRFFTIMYTTGIVACLAAAVLLAPLFAGEYTNGTDQLILSSRHGKGSLIRAKLFVGATITAGLTLLCTVQTYLQCMLTYGWDGANTAVQLVSPLCTFPLNMGQVALLQGVCAFMACLLTSAVNMLLSAKLKTPFGVIILTGILIIFPMFISDPETSVLLSNLLSLLPANMMAFWNVVSAHLFELGGLVVENYIAVPVFAGIITVVLLPLAYRGFKNHQIG